MYTESYRGRYLCQEELGWAFAAGKKILPVFPDNTKIEFQDEDSEGQKRMKNVLQSKLYRFEDGEDFTSIFHRWIDNLRRLDGIHGVFNESASKMNLKF